MRSMNKDNSCSQISVHLHSLPTLHGADVAGTGTESPLVRLLQAVHVDPTADAHTSLSDSSGERQLHPPLDPWFLNTKAAPALDAVKSKTRLTWWLRPASATSSISATSSTPLRGPTSHRTSSSIGPGPRLHLLQARVPQLLLRQRRMKRLQHT